MNNKYRIDPNFVRPEPTPADFFCTLDDPGTPEARHAAMSEVFDRWKADGIQMVRMTLTGPDIEGDETGYPAGLWLEGWKDINARQLPFGTAAEPDGPIYPPLTHAERAASPNPGDQ